MKQRTATKCHDGKRGVSWTHQRNRKPKAIVHVGIDFAKSDVADAAANE